MGCVRTHHFRADDAPFDFIDRQRCGHRLAAQPARPAGRRSAPRAVDRRRFEHGDHRALELTEDRKHLARQRHAHPGLSGKQPGARGALVSGVGVTVRKITRTERRRLPQPTGRHPHRRSVERLQARSRPRARPSDTRRSARATPAGVASPGEHVGAARDVVAPISSRRDEARGGQQAGRRALALDGVGGDRRPVQNVIEPLRPTPPPVAGPWRRRRESRDGSSGVARRLGDARDGPAACTSATSVNVPPTSSAIA